MWQLCHSYLLHWFTHKILYQNRRFIYTSHFRCYMGAIEHHTSSFHMWILKVDNRVCFKKCVYIYGTCFLLSWNSLSGGKIRKFQILWASGLQKCFKNPRCPCIWCIFLWGLSNKHRYMQGRILYQVLMKG